MRAHHLRGFDAVSQPLIDVDHLALQLLGLLVAALFLHDINENAENTRGVDVDTCRTC